MKAIARFFSAGLLAHSVAQFAHAGDIRAVVLVHGAFADGSRWDRMSNPDLERAMARIITAAVQAK